MADEVKIETVESAQQPAIPAELSPQEKLAQALESHAKWLRGEDGGVRANLTGANLTGADLYGANL
ncbi:MAG: pentapeptide repeat-containing protein, partial [Planctomycetota bacterium]